MAMTIDDIRWIQTNGGPFILGCKEKISSWGETERLSCQVSVNSIENDYMRAVRFAPLFGLIADPDGEIFVQYSESLVSAILNNDNGIFIVNYLYREEPIADYIDLMDFINEFDNKKCIAVCKLFFHDKKLTYCDSLDKNNAVDITFKENGWYSINVLPNFFDTCRNLNKFEIFKIENLNM